MMMMLMILQEAMVCALARSGRSVVWGRRGTTANSEEVKGCCRCLKTIAAC